jgi:xanthine/uracil/vitamin C permease (AzgA family)
LPAPHRKIKGICNLLPQDVRSGIVVGLGLLLTMIGLMHMHVVVASPYSMVELGAFGLPLCYGCAVLAAMMALGETSYKYTTVTCIMVAAVIHMVHTHTYPSWAFSSFDLDLDIFPPIFDFAHGFDPWFILDILTYTMVRTLKTLKRVHDS